MKKIFYAVSVLSLFVFMSCQQPTDSTGNNENTYSKWGSLEAKAVYQTFLGTWNLDTRSNTIWATSQENEFSTAIFSSDSVTLGTTRYNLNPDTDLIVAKDYSGTSVLDVDEWYGDIYIKLSDRLLAIDRERNDNDGTENCSVIWNLYNNRKYVFLTKSSSSGDGEESASSVNGTYSFSNATGSQSNGTITLSDGNFTYSGGKSQAPSSGTYTVSGSDITFSWTATGYSVSTTVTVSKSGSSVTLSSSEVLFFSTFFGSTAQSGGKYSLTFSYTE